MLKSTVRSQKVNDKVKSISIIVAVALFSHMNLTCISGFNIMKAFNPSIRHYIGRSEYDVESRRFLNKMSCAAGEDNMSPNDIDLACWKDAKSSTLINFLGLANDESYKPIIKSGLVTSAGGTLQSQFGHKIPDLSPIERIILTANGNLQWIVSSFYDAPVHVDVERCKQRGTTSDVVWDRKVHMSVFNQVFCKATSVITVHSSECAELVQSKVVGIGQIFRHLDKLPTFTLLDVGRTPEGGLWRSYQLKCQELTCNIREEFSVDIWGITEEVVA